MEAQACEPTARAHNPKTHAAAEAGCAYRTAMRTLDVPTRHARLQQLRALVAAGLAPLTALAPYWRTEAEPSIVASAVLEYLMLREVPTPESLAAVDELLDCLQRDDTQCPGAVLAGLVLTGDPRVADRVYARYPALPSRLAAQACSTHTGVLLAPAVALHLRWLDEALDGGRLDVITALTRGMTELIDTIGAPSALTVHRHFGMRCHERGVTVLSRVRFDDYRRDIVARIEDLPDHHASAHLVRALRNAWLRDARLH